MIRNALLTVLLLFSFPCHASYDGAWKGLILSPYSSLAVKWATVVQEMDKDRAALASCRHGGPCPAAARQFMSIVDSVRGLTGLAQVGHLNLAINNAIHYHSDPEGTDIWSSPLVTIETGQGDCEDYAIAKIVALEELEIPRENIRLAVLRGTSREIMPSQSSWLMVTGVSWII